MSRQAVNKSYSTTSPEQDWDYLVIGSGMGGMTTAAILTKLGKRVLILEQHYLPGGMTHTFKRHGWTWDVGVHAIGEVSEHTQSGRLLKYLTDGQLEWASLGDVYDSFEFPDGVKVGFPDSKAAFVQALTDAFPAEGAAIRRYIELVAQAVDQIKGYYGSRVLPGWLAPAALKLMAPKAQALLGTSTKTVLDRLTDNVQLKAVLAGQWGYYGLPPSRSPFALHALVTKHYYYGGYYPVGGSARIAETLLATVAKGGGWTRVKADVAGIVVERGRAAGVRLADGEIIRAKGVISAAGVPATMNLLPEVLRRQTWCETLSALPPSPGYVCLNLGFKGDIAAAGATAANQWFYESWDSDVDAWELQDAGAEAPVLYVSFPSLKDPDHDPGTEQLHTGEVVTFVPYEAFAAWRDTRWHKRGEDYEALKRELTDRLLEQLFRHRPALKPLLAYAELSTPLTTEHFTRAHKGAIYGLSPTPERFANPWLRPRTPLRGLYLAGSDVTSGGVMGAFFGGVLAALAAEPWGVVRQLGPVMGGRTVAGKSVIRPRQARQLAKAGT